MTGQGQRRAGVVMSILVLLALPPFALAEPLPPVDEAVRQPGFFSFRAQLMKTVAARDTQALLSIVSPHVRSSFGGDDGIDEFRRSWALDSAGSRFWQEMAAVLALGGSFQGPHRFVAPYTYSEWPVTEDAFTHVAVIGSNVNVRAEPRLGAAVIGSASFETLRSLEPGGETGNWTHVMLPDGRAGYIANRYIRSPVDYRAIFEKEYGRWWLTVFVAGD